MDTLEVYSSFFISLSIDTLQNTWPNTHYYDFLTGRCNTFIENSLIIFSID